ncbi:MAG: TonB-dependent receptor [Bacteroidales bacterium]|nr:TonB-dependent receptor [Bacteroidales bacterium]
MTKTIQGKIIDKAGESIVGANVYIPGTTIGTTSNLDGVFQLEIPASTKSLKISYMGYSTLEVAPENNMKITLRPDATQINEVNIVAKQTTIQVTAEKTTVYPALSPITSSGNAYSVLKNLPGVIINSDGSLYLNGKSGVKVLIDGKNTYLSGTDLVNYLMSLPASSLKKIELINHPSAKYEAAGNAGIIDISTQKTNSLGYNLNVNTSYEKGKYGRANNNIAFGYRKNKWNMNAMYGYYQGSNYIDVAIKRDFSGTATEPLIFFDQDSYRKRTYKSHYFNFSVDFYADPKTTMGVAVRGSSTNKIENGTIHSLFHTLTTESDSTIHSMTNNDENRKNLTSSLYIQHKFDSTGKEISASIDRLYYSVNENQFHKDVMTRVSGLSSEDVSQALKAGFIKMYSGRVDLAYPVSNIWRFDAGAKSDFVNISDASDNENKQNGQWINDPALSTTFHYNENINALYVSSKVKKNALTAVVGVRVENTNVKADSVNQSYTDFFPNLLLSWKLSDIHAISLTYDKRIDRPNYRDLNPFVYIFDNYTYEEGNPDLKPQFTSRFIFSYTIRKAYRFSVFYTHTRHAIIKSYFVQPGTRRVLVMPTNMSSYNSYGIQGDMAQLSLTHWLQTSLHLELVQNNYQWVENGSKLRNKDFSFQVGVQNRVNLPWGWSGEVSGFYNSRMANGQIDLLPVWQISGGVQKNLFNRKATLSIFSNDWFHSNHTRIQGVISGGNVTTNEFDDHTVLGISFTWRFKKGSDVKKTGDKKSIDSKRISL